MLHKIKNKKFLRIYVKIYVMNVNEKILRMANNFFTKELYNVMYYSILMKYKIFT